MFDMAERSLRAVCLWNNPPPPFQRALVIPSPARSAFVLPPDAPSPSGRKSIGRTEGYPHFRLLDHIQVLTGNTDYSASTAGRKRTRAGHKMLSLFELRRHSLVAVKQFSGFLSLLLMWPILLQIKVTNSSSSTR